MFYHASKSSAIDKLKPHISNHEKPLVYLSAKRENVLVYLSNAVEKYCKQISFRYDGIYKKWGSYGFTKEGLLRLEEYYPNATIDTYKGESGYIYFAEHIEKYNEQEDIPYAVTSEYEVPVDGFEYISDAYEAIMNEVKNGRLVFQKYENNSQAMLAWIEKSIKAEYQNATDHPEYKAFLKGKFAFLSS